MGWNWKGDEIAGVDTGPAGALPTGPETGLAEGLFGCELELLTTDGGFEHQAAFGMHKHDHALAILGFSLYAGGRTGTGPGAGPLAAGLRLSAGRNGYGRGTRIKFELPRGEFVIGALVFEKNDFAEGLTTGQEAEAAATRVFKKNSFCITIDLGLGSKEATVHTCDLSADYVKINADYRT